MTEPGRPYVGLRPFECRDASLFFGREREIEALRQKIRDNRFVAVVGSSGNGKSSLVMAGLIPRLRREGWQTCTLRPLNDPLGNLADACARLIKPTLIGQPEQDAAVLEDELDLLPGLRERAYAVLQQSSFGLSELMEERPHPETRLLVVVDQFEEIFRFASRASRNPTEEALRWDDAAAFTSTLLQASEVEDPPVSVLLTMRSEYIGECARYPALSRAVSESQFLVPQMSRSGRQKAIEEPAKKFGATIERALVLRLLNDSGDEPDQLPVLQHALLRYWQKMANEGREPRCLRLTDYKDRDKGGLGTALSQHADELLSELANQNLREVAERVFKSLTDIDPRGQKIRRPRTFDQLRKETGASAREVQSVLAPFRLEGANFLTPPLDSGADPRLKDDDQVDISHEALIRRWSTLGGGDAQEGWVEQEAQDGRNYRNLVTLLPGPIPYEHWRRTRSWWDRRQPTLGWAARYGDKLDDVRKMRARAPRKRYSFIGAIIGITVLVVLAALGAGIYMLRQHYQNQQLAEQLSQAEAKLASTTEQLALTTDEKKRLARQVDDLKRRLAEASADQLVQPINRVVELGEMFGINELITTAIIAALCALVPAGAVIAWARVQGAVAARLSALANRLAEANGLKSPPKPTAANSVPVSLAPAPDFDNTVMATARIIALQRHPVAGYLLPGILFTMASAFGFFVIFIVPGHPEVWLWPNLLLSGQVHADAEALGRYQEETAVIISAAFLGAYLSAVWHLMRRSPQRAVSYSSFLVATMQILLACVLAAILRHVLAAFGTLPSRWLSVLYGIGFIIGIGIAPLLNFVHWASSETSGRFRAWPVKSHLWLPLDFIEGVTPAIRLRLAKAGITDAQNLATANPIELWAETTYELLEIIDWVAQAQLMLAVSQRAAAALRNCGVRTVFDFERVAGDEAWLPLIAGILFAEVRPQPEARAVWALCKSLSENPHVSRLRDLQAAARGRLSPTDRSSVPLAL
jgi:hypothetical protein